jgi:hypothetical protein
LPDLLREILMLLMDDERLESLLRSVMDLGKQLLAMEGHLAELESADDELLAATVTAEGAHFLR